MLNRLALKKKLLKLVEKELDRQPVIYRGIKIQPLNGKRSKVARLFRDAMTAEFIRDLMQDRHAE